MFNINIEGDVRDNKFEINKNQQEVKDLLRELVSSLLRVQSRKHTLKTENQKNDALTDSLRDKGFYVADQSRQGRSGSEKTENYDSGELDLVILDASGNIVSVIEALELNSLGEKNETVKHHINKLLNRYDTAGNEENFVVIYSNAKNFAKLWDNYKKFVDQKVFPDESDIEELEMPKGRIKGGRNYYTLNSKKLCLYHLFVDMKLADFQN